MSKDPWEKAHVYAKLGGVPSSLMLWHFVGGTQGKRYVAWTRYFRTVSPSPTLSAKTA
jgi:hypothetical protein